MRRVIAVLCIVVGAVPLLLGTAAAVLVGPDDRVDLRERAAPAGVQAVVVPHDLVPLTGVTLHVEARAESGDVLVGSAHPVDVASYTGVARRLVVKRVGADGRPVGDVRGAPDAAPLDVAAATFWTAEDRGAGTRSIDVPLTDEPVAVVVATAVPAAPIRFGVGLEINSAFTVAAACAVGGGLLVGTGLVLLLRGGAGRPRTTSTDAHERVPATTPEDVERAAQRVEPGVRRRLVAVGAAVAGATALAGCSPVPGLADRAARPERPALTAAEQSEPEPTPHPYQVASQAAAAGDPSAWAQVTGGPELEIRELSTRIELARAATDGTPVDGSTYELVTLEEIDPSFTSYPLYRVLLAQAAGDETAPPFVRLLERRDVLDAWHVRAEASVPAGTTLRAADGPISHAPTEDDLARAAGALDAVEHYLATGDGTGVVAMGDLAEVRHDLLPVDELGAVVQSLTVQAWGDQEDPFGRGGASRAFGVADGTLTVLALDVSATLSSTSADEPLRFTDPVVAELVGQPGWRTSLRTESVVVVAAVVSHSGDVTVLGADAAPVHRP
ncbi:hypothetical protein [Cellulomonas fimi]|uniref:Uncharacterized protein n=1 Tax=Cellulomonas fimi (strain ATCC 484 / DSM 20113 / JCM 1341 / CCUG 24087 / LMG 16345 / NBRC 15513 / NCIMB 8980 / NCTC 7547 / NRS-133) TaxID=590998 RepID=F4H572_CELFA|nr:hypothetical protein [Cellulomonas fimi]AEE46678.1 hypothetical protein Celf_2553 [Cellulomonas fimi ATCC 484]NNH07677.1 hypothetical protein [Cellulomonas fimi]VEH33858.1 Uncharacterised protein [Cellulomonas fimi]